jgi:serine protease
VVKYHGTHVAGTIGASGTNNEGIEGIVADNNICFLIARVFGESGDGAKMSDVFTAVEWLVNQGAKVVNMSLGGTTKNTGGDALFQQAHANGAILVAAAGNDGTTAFNYPANYNSVLSVGAIDADFKRASFSQYNTGVALVAPGVNVLSTYPLNLGGALLLSAPSAGAIGKYMERITSSPNKISGQIVVCPNFGIAVCPGNGSGTQICLIERYVLTT